MKINKVTTLNTSICSDIENLEKLIFANTYRPGRFSREAPLKKSLMALLGFEGEKLVAYKVGYELKDGVFYSWVGGVHPEFRKKGFAKQLMSYQHKNALEAGYSKVQTKTRMTYRGMLILNLQIGFDITGLSFNKKIPGLVIQMEKDLKPTDNLSGKASTKD